MPRSNERSLGEIIKEVLHVHGLREKVTEAGILSVWEKIMGKPIAAYTTGLQLKKKCLTVYLRSAVLRNELAMAKSKIIKMINDEFGKEIVNDIVFR